MATEQRRGASQPASAGFGGQLRAYYGQHLDTLSETWRRLWGTPLSTLMTWLLVGVALTLPCGLYLVLNNADTLREGWSGTTQISVYLKDSVDAGEGRKFAVRLGNRDVVESSGYISREQALEDFERLSGIEGVTRGFKENPLPASIALILRDQDDLPRISTQLQQELSADKRVEEAQLDQQWLERLYHLVRMGERMAWALALLLAVAIVLTIGNTIRLSIENRRDEILILKLAGGTNAYVQRPFLYYGLLFGLGGGLSCLLILAGIYVWIQPPLAALSEAYGSGFSLHGPSLIDGFLLLLVSSFLGVIGAVLAVTRHLRAIEPK